MEDLKVNDYQITGIAAPYNKRSQNLGGFVELIEYGAFESVLATNPTVTAVIDHGRESLKILGSTKAGTLQLRSTPKGLEFTLDLPKTSTGSDALELIKRGELNKMSFAFTTKQDTWELRGDEMIRTIKGFDSLTDVSIVLNPAYLDTEIN